MRKDAFSKAGKISSGWIMKYLTLNVLGGDGRPS